MNFAKVTALYKHGSFVVLAHRNDLCSRVRNCRRSKSMLARAVSAVKDDEGKALAMSAMVRAVLKIVTCTSSAQMHQTGRSRLRRTTMGQNLQPSHPAKR